MIVLILATALFAFAAHELRGEMQLATDGIPGGLLIFGLILRMMVLMLGLTIFVVWLGVFAGSL